VATKEIDLSDVFSIKILRNIFFWLDNFTQELYIDVYMGLAAKNTLKNKKVISLTAVDVTLPPAPAL